MTKLFSRWLPGVTLTAWSAILLYFFFSGRLSSFLVPAFRPYVLIAGLVLLAMASVFLTVSTDAACCSSTECGHPLSRVSAGKVLTFLVLLLPITVAALFSPDAFGRATIENRGLITDASGLGAAPRREAIVQPIENPLPTKDGSVTLTAAPAPAPAAGAAAPTPGDYLQRTPDGTIVAEVLDLLYAAQDPSLRGDFEGNPVQLIGQLMADKTSPGGPKRFKAVRMFMTCCAADARPVATLVECDPLPALPEMTWVKVTGISTFPTEGGRRVAVIAARSVVKTDPPEESMLY